MRPLNTGNKKRRDRSNYVNCKGHKVKRFREIIGVLNMETLNFRGDIERQ